MVSATDFGTIGKTYPILEQDMIVQIQARVQAKMDNGELAQLHQQWRNRAKDYVRRPLGQLLPQATEPRVTKVESRLTLKTDLKDEHGRILYPKGTVVDPLKIMSLNYVVCFIDGDNQKQVIWLQETCADNPLNKLVLVNGDYVALSERTGLRLYFDQHGKLTERLNIRALPAVFSQRGDDLYVEEISLF